jgi:hypothetical protein
MFEGVTGFFGRRRASTPTLQTMGRIRLERMTSSL